LTRPFINPLESEGAASFYPQQNWVALVGQSDRKSKASTVMVVNRGLPEYEIYPDAGKPKIGVTLLRCVGYLSRRNDGPEIETPEAQCLGAQTFEYALVESRGDWQQAEVWKQAHQFNVPLMAVQTIDGEINRDLPESVSFISIEPAQLVVTAIKRAEDDPHQLVVRFFNMSDERLTGGRISIQNVISAEVVNLLEEGQKLLSLDPGGTVHLGEIRPKEIVTLAFRIK